MSNNNQRPWYKDPKILVPAIVAIVVALIVGLFALYAALPQTPTTPMFREAIGEIDTDGSYEISWESSKRATKYTLQEDMNYSFTSPRTVYGGSETKKFIYGKSDGDYYYRVRGCNDAGESDWSPLQKIGVLISLPSTTTSTPTITPTPTPTKTPKLMPTPIPTSVITSTPTPIVTTPTPTSLSTSARATTLTPTVTPTSTSTSTPTPTPIPTPTATPGPTPTPTPAPTPTSTPSPTPTPTPTPTPIQIPRYITITEINNEGKQLIVHGKVSLEKDQYTLVFAKGYPLAEDAKGYYVGDLPAYVSEGVFMSTMGMGPIPPTITVIGILVDSASLKTVKGSTPYTLEYLEEIAIARTDVLKYKIK